MAIVDVVECPKCGKLVVHPPEQLKSEALVEHFYHCPAMLTIQQMTFREEIIKKRVKLYGTIHADGYKPQHGKQHDLLMKEEYQWQS